MILFRNVCPLFLFCGDVHGSRPQRSVLMAERDAAGSSARRRRERRLRSFWRHEKLAIQMALSEAMHHSAPRGAWHVSNAALRGQKPDRAGDAAGTEFYAMSEVDELPAAGVRPPSLGEPPGPAVKVGRVLQPGAFELPSLDVSSAADGGPVGGCFGVLQHVGPCCCRAGYRSAQGCESTPCCSHSPLCAADGRPAGGSSDDSRVRSCSRGRANPWVAGCTGSA